VSGPGAEVPPPNVMQISRPWLRDLTIAAEILARPLSIFISSCAASAALFTVTNGEWRVAAMGLVAGMAGGVAFLKSRDKIAEITGSKP